MDSEWILTFWSAKMHNMDLAQRYSKINLVRKYYMQIETKSHIVKLYFNKKATIYT